MLLVLDCDSIPVVLIRWFFFLMIRRPPRSTRTDTLFPYTTLVRSAGRGIPIGFHRPASAAIGRRERRRFRSEEHTSELQSLMRISYAVFCLKKKNIYKAQTVTVAILSKVYNLTILIHILTLVYIGTSREPQRVPFNTQIDTHW